MWLSNVVSLEWCPISPNCTKCPHQVIIQAKFLLPLTWPHKPCSNHKRFKVLLSPLSECVRNVYALLNLGVLHSGG